MCKTYEALVKAEREQAGRKKGKVLSGPVPKSEIEEPKGKTRQGKQPISPDVHHERYIGRVPVDNLIAKPDSILAEQFRKLQAIVISHSITHTLRSILVTSCIPDEGKTYVSLNLSATIARGLDDSAILIDADLRKRTLSSRLGLQNILGLSDVLEETATIEETLVNTEFDDLTILPAGASPPNPAELIASTRMKRLIQQLEASHRDSYIIIDSTPIAATSEANALSQMADGVIVVIMADKTRRDVVRRELKTIASEKILGVVLNCAEFETSDSYNNYYKSYYGKKKK
jgi:capsular exopolysaccharide synthesis family protein